MLISLAGKPALFIHIPKTGGNSLQTHFFNKNLSLDQKVLAAHQDGVDRFGLKGKYTTHKHMTLQDYWVHKKLRKLPVVACVRHPISRLISLYLSPHRKFQVGMKFPQTLQEFDFFDFSSMVLSTRSSLQYLCLTVEDYIVMPSSITLLRTETLAQDCKKYLGFNLQCHVNKGTADFATELEADPRIASIIMGSHHCKDEMLFY